VKIFEWNLEKNEWLKKVRDISFAEIVESILSDGLLDIIDNPSKNFPKQKVFVVFCKDYVYYVPFVEEEKTIFLKTIIPSRKILKKYQNKLKIMKNYEKKSS